MSELPDIQTGISRPELFELFKSQLKKDFESCGLDGTFADNLHPDFDLIIEKVSKEVQKLLKGNKWMELLYRIDISERQFQKLSTEKKEASQEIVLAELIIKRELQKVVIKEFFRKK
jgi:hypothetical protein